MKYLSTTFHIECNDATLLEPIQDLLAQACGECGYESFMEENDHLVGYVQRDLYDESALNDAILSVTEQIPCSITYTTEEVPDENWNATWEAEGFDPIDVDGRVTIYDAHHMLNAQFSTPIQISIQAQNAFGTGTHQTTRMIVSTLLSLPLSGRRVLDCGCGTGILAIAAIKCGAKEAVAYDIDEWSVENAQHNGVLNGVAQQLEVLQGDAAILNHIEGIFDVVMANINRNILLNDMPAFVDVMAADGTLILSGFYEDDATMLIEKAATLNLHEASRKTEDGWCCIEFIRSCAI